MRLRFSILHAAEPLMVTATATSERCMLSTHVSSLDLRGIGLQLNIAQMGLQIVRVDIEQFSATAQH
jgi:hypothetical protein